MHSNLAELGSATFAFSKSQVTKLLLNFPLNLSLLTSGEETKGLLLTFSQLIPLNVHQAHSNALNATLHCLKRMEVDKGP